MPAIVPELAVLLIVPRVVGLEKLPVLSESCAVYTFPELNVPEEVKGIFTEASGQKGEPEMVFVVIVLASPRVNGEKEETIADLTVPDEVVPDAEIIPAFVHCVPSHLATVKPLKSLNPASLPQYNVTFALDSPRRSTVQYKTLLTEVIGARKLVVLLYDELKYSAVQVVAAVEEGITDTCRKLPPFPTGKIN